MCKEIVKYKASDIIEMDAFTRFHPDLTWGQKVFLCEIRSQCNKGRFYYHKPTLAKYLGVAEITVYEWVKDLASKNLIEVIFDPCDLVCKTHILLKKRNS